MTGQPPPDIATRAMGSREGAAAILAACIAVIGLVALGQLPWWLALFALGLINGVRVARRKLRAHNAWTQQWNAMADVMPVEAKAGEKKKTVTQTQREEGKPRNIWAEMDIPVGLVLLLALPWLAGQAESTSDKQILALFWLLDIVALAYGVVLRVLRRRKTRRAAVPVTAPPAPAAPQDDGCVAWLIGRATSAPSRLDALGELPDYCARMVEQPQTGIAPETH